MRVSSPSLLRSSHTAWDTSSWHSQNQWNHSSGTAKLLMPIRSAGSTALAIVTGPLRRTSWLHISLIHIIKPSISSRLQSRVLCKSKPLPLGSECLSVMGIFQWLMTSNARRKCALWNFCLAYPSIMNFMQSLHLVLQHPHWAFSTWQCRRHGSSPHMVQWCNHKRWNTWQERERRHEEKKGENQPHLSSLLRAAATAHGRYCTTLVIHSKASLHLN